MYLGRPGGCFTTGQAYKAGKCTELTALLANNEQNQISCHQTFVHSTEGLHKCADCGSVFNRRKQLLYHVKTKHMSKRFVCSQCLYTFASRGGVTEHVKHVHQKLARYQCAHCGKGYSHRSHYLDHLATHTGVKRNVCPICQRQFTFGHSLKEHIVRIHPSESATNNYLSSANPT